MAHKKDDDREDDIELEETGPGLVQFDSTEVPKCDGPIAVANEDSTFFDIV